MGDAHEFLKALAIVLCVAAVTTVLFQRLRQPVVLGYLLAGMLVGPALHAPLVTDTATIATLSELGVILLMFSIGLEFSVARLVRVAPTAGLTALVGSSLMLWLGFAAAHLYGWSTRTSLLTGAIVAISSTTIVVRVFDEQQVRGRVRELVVGILVVQDLIAILLLAVLTALFTGARMSAADFATTAARLASFLAASVAFGLLVVPRAVRAVARLRRSETLLVAVVGLCFAFALVAKAFGYSVALGAFLAGSLVGESGEGRRVEQLVEPLRDIFAAVFFVSVGMAIDPGTVAKHPGAVVLLVAVVLVGQTLSIALGAFLTGNGVRTSVRAGLSLAQIGEFSFILAGLGLSMGASGKLLYPLAVAVSATTTLATPWLVRASDPVAAWVDRKLPKSLQTFAALYGSWLEELRATKPQPPLWRAVRMLGLDTALLAGVIIGTSVSLPHATRLLSAASGLKPGLARWGVMAGGLLVSVPLVWGIVRNARRLGTMLAALALPAQGRVDLAAAPRRVLLVTLQLGVVLAVGLPLLVVTQPFVRGLHGAVVPAALLAGLGVVFWRRARDLQGHVRAGAEAIVQVLQAQAQAGAAPAPDSLAQVRRTLPGLGAPVPLRLEPGDAAVGRSLAQLNLRGLTGATVLALTRGGADTGVPAAHEPLHAGDVLALAGTHEAVEAALTLLRGAGASEVDTEPGPAGPRAA